ncbi:MAG: hypothetical protein WBP93_16655 [Pyrinomonadaceae bacterium]
MPSVSRGRRRAGFRFQGTSLTARFQTNLYAQHGLRASSAGGSPHVSYLIESEVGRFVNKEKGIRVREARPPRQLSLRPTGATALPAAQLVTLNSPSVQPIGRRALPRRAPKPTSGEQ